jgi:NTP pyrophosphatase (non-canonical NTP hydrolase)
MMSWTKHSQARLDYLRNAELTGTLTDVEQAELASLMARVEAEEAQALAPTMSRLRAEVGELGQEITSLQSENEELARLLAQQQTLAADARRFLADFEQRRTSILDALARFAGGPLTTT